MQYSEINGYSISKLILGTVALGQEYGVSNREGKPSTETSFKILSSAVEEGINTLDTARSYGDAESVIGNFLTQAQPKVTVVTKFKFSADNLIDKVKLKEQVYQSINTSLDRLHLKKIPIYLFHSNRHLPLRKLVEFLPDILEDLHRDGLIDMGGISVDHPDEAELTLQYPAFKVLQIPLNIFDLRLTKNGMISQLRDRGKIIFARSVFLQGLFFMSPQDLKGTLAEAKKYLVQLHRLAIQAHMTIAQLAFSFIRDMPEITSIVFGAVNAEQVKQNVELLQGAGIEEEIKALIHASFEKIPENIITPGLWSI